MNPREREKSSQSYTFTARVRMDSAQELSFSTEIQGGIDRIAHLLRPMLQRLIAEVTANGARCAEFTSEADGCLRRAVVAQIGDCPRKWTGFDGQLCAEIKRNHTIEPAEGLGETVAKHFGFLDAEANGLAEEVAKVNELAAHFVEPHMGLVRKIAKLVRSGRSILLAEEDLYQEGAIALRIAALRFNPDCGARFSTFAFAVVRNHLTDLNRCSICSTDYSARNLAEFAFTAETLFQRLGRTPMDDEVFDELDWPSRTRKSVKSALSLVAPSSLGSNDEQILGNAPFISDSSPHYSLERAEELQRLDASLKELPKDEAAVIKKHHFQGLSLREIARQDGESGQKVRELHGRAFEKLTRAQPDAPVEQRRLKGA